jgi:glucosamine-6-phosphate deaminase
MAVLNFLEETRFEKLPVSIYPDHIAASNIVAKRIAGIISENDRLGKKTVLGLATGATPLHVYKELIRLHKEQGLSFKTLSLSISTNIIPCRPMRRKAMLPI